MIKTCPEESQNLLGIRTEKLGTLNKDPSNLCCPRHKFTTEALLFNAQYFILLAVNCSATIYVEGIVTLPLQQLLREHDSVDVLCKLSCYGQRVCGVVWGVCVCVCVCVVCVCVWCVVCMCVCVWHLS